MSANAKSTLVFGTDPEFFAGYNNKITGNIDVLPAPWFREFGKVDFIPDVKHPVFIDRWEDLGVIAMEDGVAFEASIRPSTNWHDIFDRVQLIKRMVQDDIISQFPNECNPVIYTLPTIGYDVERWMEYQNDPDFLMSMIFGCDPDKDAFNKNKKGEDVDALMHPFRYGGGHIHISGSPIFKIDPVLSIQCLAISLGLAAVAFSDAPELDKARTYLYGRPGKYRLQEYKKLFNGIPHTDVGVEYRTPSNRWTSSIEHAEQIFKWAEIGVHEILETGLGNELLPKIGEETCEAIVSCDQNKAKELLAFVESSL